MKYKFSLLIISIVIIFVCNCCYPLNTFISPWSSIDKKWISTYFDDSINTNLSQRIRIDGYYMIPSDTLYSERVLTTYGNKKLDIKDGVFNRNLLFFENGIVSSFIFKNNIFIEQNNINLKESILYEDSVWGYGGRYTIKQDTIKVVTAWTSCKALGYELWEESYQIIDSCTIKLVEIRYRLIGRDDLAFKRNDIYKFYSCYNLPNSDNILLKKSKLFWKSKDSWKAYIQRMKSTGQDK